MFRKEKKYYFLTGLPRSGNTLLGSILNQNKNICVTAQSPVSDILYGIENFKNNDYKFKNFPDEKSAENVSKKIFENYYKDWKSDYIIDRSCWGTPDNLELLKKYCPNEIKIIVLIRDLNEVLASFIRWSEINPGNFLDLYKTREEKCEFLMNSDGQIMRGLQSLYNLFENKNNHTLFIKYDDLVTTSKEKISEIYKFLNIKEYKHNFKNITNFRSNHIEYDDQIFGKNLHKVKQNILKSKYNYIDYIPQNIIKKYKSYNSLYLTYFQT
jgi:sulfotransferase